MADALAGNRCLELDISGHALTEVASATLAHSLAKNRTLTKLDASDNELGDGGVETISRALSSTGAMSGLTTLVLRSVGITVRGVRVLMDSLARGGCIARLTLQDNGLGPDGAAAIADMLPANTKLRSLSLRFNKIGDAGVRDIARALAKSAARVHAGRSTGGITALDLSGNSITDAGAIALARPGSSPPVPLPLVRLGLRSNKLGDTGLAALASALTGGAKGSETTVGALSNLRQLYCGANTALTGTGVASLARVLPLTIDLVRVDLQGALDLGGLRELAAARETHRCAS